MLLLSIASVFVIVNMTSTQRTEPAVAIVCTLPSTPILINIGVIFQCGIREFKPNWFSYRPVNSEFMSRIL